MAGRTIGAEIDLKHGDVNKYITEIDDGGIKIHPKIWEGDKSYIQLDGNGMYIKDKDDNTIGIYTSEVILGRNDGTQSYLLADYHSLQLIDKEGNSYVYFSDLRDKYGEAEIIEYFTGDGRTKQFSTQFSIIQLIKVLVDDVDVTSTTSYLTSGKITLQSAPSNGAKVAVTYVTTDAKTKVFTFGSRTGTIGAMSFSAGLNVEASAYLSHAEGASTVASGKMSHAEGFDTTASGGDSHAEGYKTVASGGASHAEGSNTTASASGDHAEGTGTIAKGGDSHAEGYNTTASGLESHAEGSDTTASGSQSHAEGSHTTASGGDSHAEGFDTTASGGDSHAEGYKTVASGSYSHAEGNNTIAAGECSHVGGKFNKRDIGSNFIHILGNGTTDSKRSNAFTVDWNGNARQYPTVLSLGTYVATGLLTSSAGSLQFSIPTGRLLGEGVSITRIRFNIVVRASNANGTGYYIVKASSSGSDMKAFDSNSNFTFYNANNVSKTLTTSQVSKSIQGQTNISITMNGGTDFYAGTSTIRNYINNNACVVSLSNIIVELSY